MNHPHMDAGLSRRQFLRLGTAGAISLAAFGGAATLTGCGRQPVPAAPGLRWLTAADVALFTALLPAVNGPALPDNPAARSIALQRIDQACACLDPPAQANTRKLLDLLHWPLFRRLACGVPAPWPEASPAELAHFLERWRGSRVALFNAGHNGLVKLAALGWWSQPWSWLVSRYPGPPAWAVAALEH